MCRNGADVPPIEAGGALMLARSNRNRRDLDRTDAVDATDHSSGGECRPFISSISSSYHSGASAGASCSNTLSPATDAYSAKISDVSIASGVSPSIAWSVPVMRTLRQSLGSVHS